MKILAIIPARSGSKSIPNKNLIKLNNHPLISYSIKFAKTEALIDRVVCSTDSKEIADVALRYGAEVPFLRPKSISRDNSTDIELILFTLRKLEKKKYYPDFIAYIRPTSPLRYKGMVCDAVKILKHNLMSDSVRSVSLVNHTPYKMWKINKSKLIPILKLKNILEPYNTIRQKLPLVYIQTGHLEIIKVKTIKKQKSITGKNIYPLIVKPEFLVDIDNYDDLHLATLKYKKLNCIKV